MIILDPMPKPHKAEPVSRHAEAYMPPVRPRQATHFGHRPGTLDGCYGKRCVGMHKPSREVQK